MISNSHGTLINNDLNRHNKHCIRALCSSLSGSVPYGVLGLQGEKKTCGKPVSFQDAWDPLICGVTPSTCNILLQEVSMQEADKIVNTTKHNPGSIKTCCEHQDTISPGGIKQGCVKIRNIAPSFLGNILVCDIGQPVFQHHPLFLIHFLHFFLSTFIQTLLI